ncbi:type II secretion system protein N [Pseudoruegeria sp. SHC-113]|uniref:type II secretion system protein N n=1 Tax=Pseudoruegeria sp. SHC-113 TaxID=2855439 RepID=UPI0021BB7C31|nr:type II secretion system protein N [Pseudoruegeria sp. SHC-113]MCT8161667.1 hypothetical protein [Pseudoruegeria sp. SHC-113]
MARLPLLAGIAAAAALGGALYLAWQDLRPVPREAASPAQAAAPAPAPEPAAQPQPAATVWPPLFGEPQPPSAQASTPTPPAPPAAAAPPVSGLGYSLVGLFESEAGKWAILSHPTGSALLREGDTLAPGLVVAKITEEGIWFGEADTQQFLAFPDP